MKKLILTTLALSVASFATPSIAKTCQVVHHKADQTINVHSAVTMGTRLQLPANLIAAPQVSNGDLWDVKGVVGTSQIVLKPNSNEKNGAKTMIFAYTDDGQAYDIIASRVKTSKNEPCVVVNPSSHFFKGKDASKLRGFVSQAYQRSGSAEATVLMLQEKIAGLKNQNRLAKKRAVMAALAKYRFHIYTRYTYDEGKEFVGKNTVADVYDDGRFTYIRLANPNRGILSVETTIGGKNAIAPTSYDDAYGIYRITGIYPNFTLRIDNVKIKVARRDNASHGAS